MSLELNKIKQNQGDEKTNKNIVNGVKATLQKSFDERFFHNFVNSDESLKSNLVFGNERSQGSIGFLPRGF